MQKHVDKYYSFLNHISIFWYEVPCSLVPLPTMLRWNMLLPSSRLKSKQSKQNQLPIIIPEYGMVEINLSRY
jgi:hypothetical protein